MTREPMTREEIVEDLRIWSGALPAIVDAPARPWNGRELSGMERLVALSIYLRDGAQAAYEWLSENAR